MVNLYSKGWCISVSLPAGWRCSTRSECGGALQKETSGEVGHPLSLSKFTVWLLFHVWICHSHIECQLTIENMAGHFTVTPFLLT